MFKNIMLGVMTVLVVGWVIIYTMPTAEADHENRRLDFERVGSADGCDVYTTFSNGVRIFLAVGNQYRTCSVAR